MNKLRQLQLCELEILNEFVRICEKYGLRYYLVGGTLLGAVRHQGFIPWDDDIDVAMLRTDYERFADICRYELGEKYFYQNVKTDPYYFLTYAKLRKNNTEFYEERFCNAKFHKGIFIDIIPLDVCPRPGILCHFLFNILAVTNYCGQVDSGEKYCPYRELSGKIGYAVLRLFNKQQIVKLRKRICSLSAFLGDGSFLASYSGAYGYQKEVFPEKWFGVGSPVIFEGKEYCAPLNVHAQLSQIYEAEYMLIPPEKERKTHVNLEKTYF